MGNNLLVNYESVFAVILFGIGLSNLLLQKNMIKKIIGLNIMDTAIYLFLATVIKNSVNSVAATMDSAVMTAIHRNLRINSEYTSCRDISTSFIL